MGRRLMSVLLVLMMVLGIGTSALAAEQANKRAEQQFKEDVSKLQPFLKMTSEGFFEMSARSAKEVGISAQSYTAVKTQFAEINAELQKMTKDERLQLFQTAGDATKDGDVHSQWCFWAYVPKWALQAYAWMVIIMGGVTATIGMFLNYTIVGVPAGAVVGALGLWVGMTGSALLWYVDNYYTSRWVLVCM